MLECHIAAFLAGLVLDLIVGDPHWLPHPIRLIGSGIAALEKLLYKEKHPLLRGGVLVVLMLAAAGTVSWCILAAAYRIHPLCGVVCEGVMTGQIMAVKSLRVESMRVCERLKAHDLAGARRAVSMIVGRDTQSLDEGKIVCAAVETVAENTSDGVVAPMLCLALGGPVLGFLYKTVNTMDSMIGYKNDRYLYFGRAAAKLDDAVNCIPARVSAFLMITCAFLLGKEFDGKSAYRIYRRDRRKHASPNSAHTEAVCSGALGIRLAGDAVYFGKLVKKPYIGDDIRPVEAEDIRRANKLLYGTSALCTGICLFVMCAAALLC